MKKSISIYPKPRIFKWLDGEKTFASETILHMQADAKLNATEVDFKARLSKLFFDDKHSESVQNIQTHIYVNKRTDIHDQGYILQWNKDGLLIEWNTSKGLHYALVTLEQIVLRTGLKSRYFRIEDEPDFLVRGFMLDIGRNKIPKMETLYTLIDRMSELKLNHIQLYMEGYAFEYEKYGHLFTDSTPITAVEFQRLDQYASKRFIDLVPNQNCFGHMGDWLANSELKHLAEHPDGIPTPFNFNIPPFTLNPTDEESIELVEDLFDELLPHFSSPYVNVNMDEPFGLGTGESKECAKKVGVGKLYLEYAHKIFEIARRHNKKILMWGDVLTKHPEVLDKLPEDVTVLEWNYDDHVSFEKNCQLLSDHRTPFYVCPGTSSWSSISGRTENMLNNISDAAINGKKYGAKGLIVTDWGDAGHWQVLPISYPGMIHAAGQSWQVERNLDSETAIEKYASEVIFRDQSGEIGNLLMELGRYYHLENSTVENATYTNHLLNHGLSTREAFEKKMNTMMKVFLDLGGSSEVFHLHYKNEDMLAWLNKRKEQLSKLDMHIANGDIVKDELANIICLIEQGVGLHHYTYKIGYETIHQEIKLLQRLQNQLEQIISEFNRLWLLRNRQGGLTKSTKALYKLLEQYKARIDELIKDH